MNQQQPDPDYLPLANVPFYLVKKAIYREVSKAIVVTAIALIMFGAMVRACLALLPAR